MLIFKKNHFFVWFVLYFIFKTCYPIFSTSSGILIGYFAKLIFRKKCHLRRIWVYTFSHQKTFFKYVTVGACLALSLNSFDTDSRKQILTFFRRCWWGSGTQAQKISFRFIQNSVTNVQTNKTFLIYSICLCNIISDKIGSTQTKR
jgi:hypothetical protein